MDMWVASMAKRVASRILILLAIALSGVLLLVLYNYRVIYNVFRGPFEITPSGLASIHSAREGKIYFIRVRGSDSFDTGVLESKIAVRDGIEVSRTLVAEYYALVVGDKFLIVRTPFTKSARPLSVEGTLSDFPASLRSELNANIGSRELEQRYYPYYLKIGSIKGLEYVFIGAVIILGFTFLWIAWPNWKCMRVPFKSPVIKKISGWGEIYQVSAEIERGFKAPGIFSVGHWSVTVNYLVHSGFFSFDVFRFEDLLLAYKEATRYRINLIPVGTSHKLHLIYSGCEAVIWGNERGLDNILRHAAARAPWAIVGFFPEILARYYKNPAKFQEELEQRKRRLS